jgi:hypothetical protein
MKRLVLVFLFVLKTNFCMAENPEDMVAERYLNRDMQFQNTQQKIAQENNYNQRIHINQSYTDGEWINRNKTVIKYDDLGNMTEVLRQSVKNEEWINSSKYTYTYDGQGKEIGYAGFSWNDHVWSETSKAEYIFDDKGNMIERLSFYLNDGEWENAGKMKYTNDMNGNPTEELYQSIENDEWETYQHKLNTYDEHGNKTETLLGQHVNNNIIITKFINTYNDRGLKAEELRMNLYDEEKDEFVNSRKITCTYDDQENIVEELTQLWHNEEWENFLMHSYTYDDQGRLVERRFQNMDGDEIQPTAKTLYSYDTITHIADNTGDSPAKILLTANYPNPFNLSTTINFSLPEAGHAELVIFNVMGQKVRNLLSGEMTPGEHSIVWDGCDDSGVPVTTGVYFSRLRNSGSTVSGRMMLVK